MDKFKSRKFWFAFLGALLPIIASILTGEIPIDQAVMESVAVVMAYIFGQGYADAHAKVEDSKK